MNNGAPHPKRVLIIDDSEDDFLIVKRLLQRSVMVRYEPVWADSAATGRERLLKEPFAAALVDYRIGGDDGLRLVAELIAEGCRCPLILLTGADQMEVDAQAEEIGAADFLNKSSLTTERLDRSIRYAMRHAQAMNLVRDTSLLLSGMLTHLPIVAGRVDEHGQVRDWRGAGLRRLGQRDGELVGTCIFERYPQVAEPLRAVLAGATRSFRWAINEQDEPVVFEATFFFDSERGSGAVGLLVDVSEQWELENQLMEATEEERRRVGRDLHDGLGQYLTGIACLASALGHGLADNDEMAEQAATLAKRANEAIAEARALSRGLCPVTLESTGLRSALGDLAYSLEQSHGIRCAVEAELETEVFDNTIAVQLFRIAQEATTNALRHGNAQSIVIRLEIDGERGALTVVDDGVGIRRRERQDGIGLRTMRHRAALIGGSLVVRPGDGSGTVVECAFSNPRKRYERQGTIEAEQCVG